MPLKNKFIPPDTVGLVSMDLLETIGVMPGDLGDFRGRLDMRTGLGSSWCLIL